MKWTSIVLALVFCACFHSCTKKVDEPLMIYDTFCAMTEGGDQKTVLAGSTIYWMPSELIRIFVGAKSGRFVSQNSYVSSVADFEGTFDMDNSTNVGSDYWAVFPYQASAECDGIHVSASIPSEQLAIAGSFDYSVFPAVAKSSGHNLNFKNVGSGIKFTVSNNGIKSVTLRGNNNEPIAGDFYIKFDADNIPYVERFISSKTSITLTAPEGKSFEVGQEYYIVTLPTVFVNGFTFTFSEEEVDRVYTMSSLVSLPRSTFGILREKDKNAEVQFPNDITNLSSGETANCYIVTSKGKNRFKASTKGNSNELLDGEPVYAEVLWESYGTNETPGIGSLIRNAKYIGGYVVFEVPHSYSGNALIAVKDAQGNVLWSWHIWLFVSVGGQNYNNQAGVMMDRNLGSLAYSVIFHGPESYGLLYQWGRKDPFLGGCELQANTLARSSVSWPAAEQSSSTTGSIDYATAHPMTFIISNSENGDWLYTGSSNVDNSRWASKKTIYDPCPAGWRVPDGGPNGIWSKARGSTSEYTTSSWEPGFNSSLFSIQNSWYPATGYIYRNSGLLGRVGAAAQCWSCTPQTSSRYLREAYQLDISYDSKCRVYPSSSEERAFGFSVRCLKE